MTKKLTPEEQETWDIINTPPPSPEPPNIASLIASQLVGVQPMSEPAGEIFKLKTRYVNE